MQVFRPWMSPIRPNRLSPDLPFAQDWTGKPGPEPQPQHHLNCRRFHLLARTPAETRPTPSCVKSSTAKGNGLVGPLDRGRIFPAWAGRADMFEAAHKILPPVD